MVKLEEVADAHFEEDQVEAEGAEPLFKEDAQDDDEYATTESEDSSDDEDEEFEEETLYERVVALKDIIPPKHRNRISNAVNAVTSTISNGVLYGGKALYVVGTVVLMIGVPFAVAVSEEQQMIEMEKEMKVCRLNCSQDAIH